MKTVIKDKLNLLPKSPGCYLMKDSQGKIIYVGKAKNLYNRVRSYFTGSHDTKTTKLISLIDDFDYIITSTETEALVLENNLIKQYNPKFNIMLTDDKTYPFICITEEKHPRIIYTRDVEKKLGQYFGPFPNAKAAKDTVNLLNRLYPLRKCTQLPKKECLYYHLGQCLAPCINEISQEDYDPILKKIKSILKGKFKNEVKELENQMHKAAEELNFEKAIEYRKNIEDLHSLQHEQKMDSNLMDSDVFAYYVEGEYLSIQVFHIRNGKMIQRSGYLFEYIVSYEESFLNFITQFYLNKNNPLPKEILIPELSIDNQLKEVLNVRVNVPKRGQKKELVNLVEINAKEKINELIAQNELEYKRTIGAVIELGELLNIGAPMVIEAFDNSNIQGASAVSAMVCFIEGKPERSLYRKYKIRTVDGPDDYATMEEVIYRRYKRLKRENLKFPDLIIVDGGKGQVEAAKKSLVKLDVSINVMGLAKDDNHKTSYIYFNENTYDLKRNSYLFYLLNFIQEEVHRFAITFHHQVHSKNILSSSLDNVAGIGPVKKRQILQLLTDEGVNIESLRSLSLTEEQIDEVLKIFSSDR